MNTPLRLYLIFAAVSLAPLLMLLACREAAGVPLSCSLAGAAAAGLLAVFAGVKAVSAGLALPVARMGAAVRRFISGGYKLDAVMPGEGWREAGSLTAVLNRLLLELSAYRAFQISQVVEDRAKAAALIETITDGVLLTDDRGRLIYSNRMALGILGIEDQPDITLPGSVKQEAFVPVISAIMSSLENYLKAEVEVPVPCDPAQSMRVGRAPPPVLKSFRVTARKFELAAFSRPGRVISIRDVTLEKEIESARETFFHMITHDMRAPIASILGYADLLRKKISGEPDSEKWLQSILRSSVRLKGMIDDILNLIKLERREMRLDLSAVDAMDLCNRVREVHEPLAARKNITLTVSPPGKSVTFRADAALLERVITNLVGNSLKFTPGGGSINVSLSEGPGGAVFAVEDTGPGIPKENQKEIFEKYSQLEEHKYMGFGLGLAMCRMAVELHGGRIWVESEPGRGCRFLFSIPAR